MLNTFKVIALTDKFCLRDKRDLDPRTIDLNLYGNLPIEILYQYEYVAEFERLNYGTITTCLGKGPAYRCVNASRFSEFVTCLTQVHFP